MNFLVLGNDKKMKYCKEHLTSLGHFCSATECENIILPLPTVKNRKIAGTEIMLEDIVKNQKKNQTVFYGNLNDNPFEYNAESYYSDKDFLDINSKLTAKAVLRIIYDNVFEDADKIKVVVLGYGRCGKAICRELKNNGINVTAAARRTEQRLEIIRNGMKATDFDNDFLCYDAIINTVPSNIISDYTLNMLNKNNLYIETASQPYGFDISKRKNNFKFILGDGLPGKYFPEEAGINIADTVLRLLNK